MIALMIAPAGAHFFTTKNEGWHFYQERKQAPSEKPTPKTAPVVAKSKSLKELKAQAQDWLEEAVENPTPDTIARYQRLQKEILERSERFAALWNENLLREPDLDTTIEHPTSYYGLLAQKEEYEQHQKRFWAQASQTIALVLLVNDTYLSRKLYTVVQTLAADRHLPWVVVDARFDPDAQKAHWGIKRLPALIMVDRTHGTTAVVAYSLQAQDELEHRLQRLLTPATGGQHT